ncbi:MAG TPA: hypothetical protein VL523_07330 [Terriglobia bacterium]|nr:hypothetical protein [Terriglobia bacterium]
MAEKRERARERLALVVLLIACADVYLAFSIRAQHPYLALACAAAAVILAAGVIYTW